MKPKINLLILLVGLLLNSCEISQVSVTPSDTITTEEFTFRGYSDLVVSHAFDVQINFSEKEESIIIEANDNLHQYIRVIKDGYTLSIGLADNVYVKGKAKLKATITTDAINGYSASGGSHLVVNDLINEIDVTLDLSGASYFTGKVHTDELQAELSGASEAEFSGFAEEFFVSASGASKLKDYTLETEFLFCELSGASLVYATINKEITFEASGASKLYYHGEASPVIQDLSGGSKIIKTD